MSKTKRLTKIAAPRLALYLGESAYPFEYGVVELTAELLASIRQRLALARQLHDGGTPALCGLDFSDSTCMFYEFNDFAELFSEQTDDAQETFLVPANADLSELSPQEPVRTLFTVSLGESPAEDFVFWSAVGDEALGETPCLTLAQLEKFATK